MTRKIIVKSTGNGACGINTAVLGLCLEVEKAIKNPDKPSSKTIEILFNTNYFYDQLLDNIKLHNQDIKLDETQFNFDQFKQFLAQVSHPRRREARLAIPLRLFTAKQIENDKADILNNEQNEIFNLFVTGFRQYVEKSKGNSYADADVIFNNIPEIQAIYKSLLQQHSAISDIDKLCNTVQPELKKIWQQTAFQIYHDKISQPYFEVDTIVLSYAAQALQWNISYYELPANARDKIPDQQQPTALINDFSPDHPNITFIQLHKPEHFDLAVSDEELAYFPAEMRSDSTQDKHYEVIQAENTITSALNSFVDEVFEKLDAQRNPDGSNDEIIQTAFETFFQDSESEHKRLMAQATKQPVNIDALFANYRNRNLDSYYYYLSEARKIRTSQSYAHSDSPRDRKTEAAKDGSPVPQLRLIPT